MATKSEVYEFWNEAACGEVLFLSGQDREAYDRQAAARYSLEPYIPAFARFEDARDQKVLEIGVGLGADHQLFAQNGALLWGIDLTERAVAHTARRLQVYGLSSQLATGDAENLEFDSEFFDVVYSWGVIHHSPDTKKAVDEIYRVLKRGGQARVMIYHKWSMVGYMLWIRYALFGGRPFTSLSAILDRYLESPGTKAYSINEAKELFKDFAEVEIRTVLTHGDLLESGAGQRHQGVCLRIARLVWPRWIIRRVFPRAGLFMLISAVKR